MQGAGQVAIVTRILGIATVGREIAPSEVGERKTRRISISRSANSPTSNGGALVGSYPALKDGGIYYSFHYMKASQHKLRQGFTLVEIMTVVAIIALLAAIAVPNYFRARKRAQATRILNDLRVLDYALDRWTIENNKVPGDTAVFNDLKPYLKTSQLLETGTDILGNPFGPFSVDVTPKVSPSAFTALAEVAPPEFWSPYY